jgi:hypothetical protein
VHGIIINVLHNILGKMKKINNRKAVGFTLVMSIILGVTILLIALSVIFPKFSFLDLTATESTGCGTSPIYETKCMPGCDSEPGWVEETILSNKPCEDMNEVLRKAGQLEKENICCRYVGVD